MPPHPVIASILVLAALGAVATAAKAGSARWNWHPELPRKVIHVGMGLVCLSFPWLFTHPLPVQILAAPAFVVLLVVRIVPALRSSIGATLHAVPRRSVGELLFPVSVAVVFTLAHDTPVHYLVPILLLTVADAAGALLGIRFGKTHYLTGDGRKSVEGSLAFLALAFLCVWLPLTLGTATGRLECLLIALILALLTMIAEAISTRGLDNFIIPVAGLFLLRILLEFPASVLVVRLAVLLALIALVLAMHRSSSLRGSALLAAAFLGYGCFALGDWRFVLPPLGLFVSHLVTTRRHQIAGVLAHGTDSILALAVSSLPWLLLKAAGALDPTRALLAFACGFAAHLAVIHCRTQRWLGRRPGILFATSKGVLLAALPVTLVERLRPTELEPSLLSLFSIVYPLAPLFVAVLGATAAVQLLRKPFGRHDTAMLFVEAAFALLSAAALLLLLDAALAIGISSRP